jgi:hypothetical protein
MSVDKHIDKLLLFSKDFEQKNNLYRHLISGRSIHFFLQFVEPELLKAYPPFSLDGTTDHLGGSKMGTIDFRILGQHTYLNDLLLSENQNSTLHIKEPLQNIILKEWLLVSYERPHHFSHVQMIEKAIDYIHFLQLDFFLKLTTGFIAIDSQTRSMLSPNFILIDDAVNNLNELIENLILVSARNYLYQCIGAELQSFNINTIYLKYRNLSQLFAKSVLHELYLRSGNKHFRVNENDLIAICQGKDVLSFLNSAQDIPLSVELVACWYPFWNRSLFMFNSPFDRKNSIR